MIIILVTFATCFTICDFFDPSKIDYCKLKCNNGEVSSGCPGEECYKLKAKVEIVENMTQFRQQTLDTHNELRNNFSKGLDPNQYPTAANMHVVNYDLELEHIARCYILGGFENGHDMCRLTSYCKNQTGAGQNLYGNTGKDTRLDRVDKAIRYWYSEISDIPKNERADLVQNFSNVFKYGASHFTQVIWGTVTRLGCVRVWYPTNPDENWKYILACNYAATDEECPGNILGKPIYITGNPCSQCGSEQCNQNAGGKYDALCGASTSAPTDTPTTITDKKKYKWRRPCNGSTNQSRGFLTLLSVYLLSQVLRTN